MVGYSEIARVTICSRNRNIPDGLLPLFMARHFGTCSHQNHFLQKHGHKQLFDSSPLISYSELKQYIFALLDDDEQVRWFVEQHRLRERYPDYSDRQIVIELGILALLNTEGIMTNLHFFKLSPLSHEGFDTEIFLNELRNTQSYYELKSILGKYQILVVLKY